MIRGCSPLCRAAAWLVVAMGMIAVGDAKLSASDGPFTTVHVAADHPHYMGRCPTIASFTAVINYVQTQPKAFFYTYRWVRSDGIKTPVVSVHPKLSDRSLVVRYPWSIPAGKTSYKLAVKLLVYSGNTHVAVTSPTVTVVCQ